MHARPRRRSARARNSAAPRRGASASRRAALTRPRVSSMSGTCTRHDVGAREQFLERERLLDARRQLPGALHGDLRIVAEHLHAERHAPHWPPRRRPRPGRPRRACAPAARSRRIASCPSRPPARWPRSSPLSPRAKAQAWTDVARGEQQPREHQLLDRVGVGARGVEHRHAAPAQLRDRDVVGAGAGARRPPAPRPGSSVACMSAERTRIASGVGAISRRPRSARAAGARARAR